MPASPSSRQPPVLWLHGFFSCPHHLDSWVQRFDRAGYHSHVPALPGRRPTDTKVLTRSGLKEYHATARAARDELDEAPIVIGHSLGALLAQKLAADTTVAALVLLGPAPPGISWTQPRALPYVAAQLPAIVAGRSVFTSEAAFRNLPFHGLPVEEQNRLVPTMVPDSGKVFRAMSFGSPSTRVDARAVTCPVLCVSGTADRNISARTHRKIARRYDAEHHTHDGAPHWIVADSLIDRVLPPVLDWLDTAVASPP